MLKLICDMYYKSKCKVKWKNKMGKSFYKSIRSITRRHAEPKAIYRIEKLLK